MRCALPCLIAVACLCAAGGFSESEVGPPPEAEDGGDDPAPGTLDGGTHAEPDAMAPPMDGLAPPADPDPDPPPTADGVTSGGGADVPPLLCDVLHEHAQRCEPGQMTSLDECRTPLAEYERRVAPEFVVALDRCLETECDPERCAPEALLAYDPSVVDADAYSRCVEDGTDCAQAVRGLLAECLERLDVCDLLDDICLDVMAMHDVYRDQLPTCLEGECADMAACISGVLGVSL